MTFRHFRIFVAVCELGSMTRASQHLRISQPSVSQAIKELEDTYGTLLFERLGKRLILTAAGELCLGQARLLLKARDDLGPLIAGRVRSELLRVGATVTIGSYILPKILPLALHPLYPVVENTARIERHIIEGKLDLALVEGEIGSLALARRSIYRDRLVIVCSPRNPAWKAKIDPRDLEGRGFYIREKGSGSREQFLAAMKKRNIAVRIAGELSNTEALKNMVRADISNFAVISALALDGSIRAMEVRGLELERDFDIVYHKDKQMTEVMSEFIALAQQALARERNSAMPR